ncbi:MAG TPA: ACP S-malonyltransferase [Thermoleophilaceae bacterium]|nr:ACP S-malonyltransferase [Thermoleophilaceae bacterium]
MTSPCTALLFPGQGSQTDDMREDVERYRPDLLELAQQEVGEDPFPRVDENTRFQQPALFCASLAGLARLDGLEPDFYAGHSMGEIAALVAAESLSTEDGLRIVALRGRVMDDAAAHAPDSGMLALRGDLELAQQLADRHGLTVANDNAPGQVVLSGHEEGLEAATSEAEEEGARTTRLPVAGGFHSPAIESAVPEFEEALGEIKFASPRAPVFSCVTAEPFDDPARELAQSLTSPVRWREILLALHERGARRFVETGPGKVLTGLVKRTLDDVEAVTAEALAEDAAHA